MGKPGASGSDQHSKSGKGRPGGPWEWPLGDTAHSVGMPGISCPWWASWKHFHPKDQFCLHIQEIQAPGGWEGRGTTKGGSWEVCTSPALALPPQAGGRHL